jgi:hypothetical protein
MKSRTEGSTTRMTGAGLLGRWRAGRPQDAQMLQLGAGQGARQVRRADLAQPGSRWLVTGATRR